MNSDMHDSTSFEITMPLGALYRRDLTAAVRRVWNASVEFGDREDSLDQHLDVATAATFACAVFQLIGVIVQVAMWNRTEPWSLDRVDAIVREEAAMAFGVAHVAAVRYAGLREFLDGNSSACAVSVEIEDEDYVFIISRDGPTIVMHLS
jgi:hypothetical protein